MTPAETHRAGKSSSGKTQRNGLCLPGVSRATSSMPGTRDKQSSGPASGVSGAMGWNTTSAANEKSCYPLNGVAIFFEKMQKYFAD